MRVIGGRWGILRALRDRVTDRGETGHIPVGGRGRSRKLRGFRVNLLPNPRLHCPEPTASVDCRDRMAKEIGFRLDCHRRPRVIFGRGQVAQLVEHRTENPGVAGSIPALPIR